MFDNLCMRWVRIRGFGVVFCETVTDGIASCWSEHMDRTVSIPAQNLELLAH